LTYQQIFIFALLAAVFGMLVWGRIRYDLVAFAALIVGILGGAVSAHEAFAGFGHETTVIIAFVLIISRAMINAGVVEMIARYVVSASRSLPAHIGIMSVIGGALSAVINNVAAIAILMSLDIEAAKKAKRSPSLSLMPLSYATILGGMVTMIGTPSNIVIAQYRERALGEPYSMFSFTPVGLVVAIAGIGFVALAGWRFIPQREAQVTAMTRADGKGLFVAEARVPEKSSAIGKTPGDFDELGDKHGVTVLGLVRGGRRLSGFARGEMIREGDFVVLEGEPPSVEAFAGETKLELSTAEDHGGLTGPSMQLIEAIVPENARAAGRSALSLGLLSAHGVTLIGVSRQGRRFRERVRQLPILPGDVLLLLGPEKRLAFAAEWLGVLPLAEKEHTLIQRRKATLAIGIFIAGVAISVAGLVTLSTALASIVAVYAAFNIFSARQVYESVEWPVIVLLGSLIPLGAAFENAGGTELVTTAIVGQTEGLPAWAILAAVMIVTMVLSDFLNSIATSLIAAPIGVGVAQAVGASPDAFLMGVAIAATCGFLTPIGHKNNTIIMGPGGYRFGDYWRIGLPLELLTVVVAVPATMLVWSR
jgi:di/tricarboxylate transporter